MARAAVAAVKAGIPAVDIACEGFVDTSRQTAEGQGVFGLPIIAYPGHIAVDPVETLKQKTRDVLLPEVIKGLTEVPEQIPLPEAWNPRDIVFAGKFDEVNEYYLRQNWGDGLPIIPPTIERVEEFLEYTPLSEDTVLGVLPAAFREATVWNVAVNGVMAGCRPEYMPVLIAIAECMAEPIFSVKDAGSTGSWEVVVILNGPVMRQLGFHHGQGMLRAGTRANMAVARFTRMYLRNIAGFVRGFGDLASYGRDYYNLVFVEDEVHSPWEPLSVDRGFTAGTNLVTLQGLTLMSKHTQPAGKNATEMLDLICRMMEVAAYEGAFFVIRDRFAPQGSHDLFCITPLIANVIADEYTKLEAQEYIWQNAKLPAWQVEARHVYDLPFKLESQTLLPPEFFESDDPNRLVPLWGSASDLEIFVGGDWSRNRCFLGRGTGRMGYTTSKEVKLPSNWSQLVPEDLPK